MSEKHQEQPAPTQRTPKGLEIPVPKRKELMAAFRKIVKPVQPVKPVPPVPPVKPIPPVKNS